MIFGFLLTSLPNFVDLTSRIINNLYTFQTEKSNDLIGDISEMRNYLHNPSLHLLEVLDDINK